MFGYVPIKSVEAVEIIIQGISFNTGKSETEKFNDGFSVV